MTSAEKGRGVKICTKLADKQFIFCGQRGGMGSKKALKSVDVIYGSPPLSLSLPLFFDGISPEAHYYADRTNERNGE